MFGTFSHSPEKGNKGVKGTAEMALGFAILISHYPDILPTLLPALVFFIDGLLEQAPSRFLWKNTFARLLPNRPQKK